MYRVSGVPGADGNFSSPCHLVCISNAQFSHHFCIFRPPGNLVSNTLFSVNLIAFSLCVSCISSSQCDMPVPFTIFVLSLSYLVAPFICTNNNKANIVSAQTTSPVIGPSKCYIMLFFWKCDTHTPSYMSVTHFPCTVAKWHTAAPKHTPDTHAAYWAVKKARRYLQNGKDWEECWHCTQQVHIPGKRETTREDGDRREVGHINHKSFSSNQLPPCQHHSALLQQQAAKHKLMPSASAWQMSLFAVSPCD